MNERRLKRMLVATAPPDEIGAQRRAWRVARNAFGEREPTPWPIRHRRPLTAAAIGVAVLAAALSSPGRAVIDEVREVVGTEKVVGIQQARPALFSLPAAGRVLVSARAGPGSSPQTAPGGGWGTTTKGRGCLRDCLSVPRSATSSRRLLRRAKVVGRSRDPGALSALVAKRLPDCVPERQQPPPRRGRRDRRPADRLGAGRRPCLAAERRARARLCQPQRRSGRPGHRRNRRSGPRAEPRSTRHSSSGRPMQPGSSSPAASRVGSSRWSSSTPMGAASKPSRSTASSWTLRSLPATTAWRSSVVLVSSASCSSSLPTHSGSSRSSSEAWAVQRRRLVTERALVAARLGERRPVALHPLDRCEQGRGGREPRHTVRPRRNGHRRVPSHRGLVLSRLESGNARGRRPHP
jgi:hypothetical protein